MKRIRVSVIVPCYNVEDYILQCIESISRQTYSDIECVLVNDCCTDNTFEIVKKYIRSYCGQINFICVEHSCNRGLSAARNTGIKVASGDYLLFVDSDDFLSDTSIIDLVNDLVLYNYPECLIGDYQCFGDRSGSFPSNNMELTCFESNFSILLSYLKYQWYPMAWNKLVKRDFLLNNNLLFTDGMLHEDEMWSYQLALNLNSLAFCHKQTYLYRIRTNSITSKKKKKNFYDNVLYCKYIKENYNPRYKRETYIFLQNRLLSILIDMFNEKYSVDDIYEMSCYIRKDFNMYFYVTFNKRNLLNICKSPILSNNKFVLRFYLCIYSILFRHK